MNLFLSPKEAFTRLEYSGDMAYLIYVRTDIEWKTSGVPDLKIARDRLVLLSWPSDLSQTSIFMEELEMKIPDKDSILYFICKSGLRSSYATEASLSLGYKNSYNIIDGFEGKPNSWKSLKLPFVL